MTVQESGAEPRAAGMKDVAAAAGVSLGTVSNVLNRPDRVTAATRAKVERAMAGLGFGGTESARSRRAGRTRSLAYVMLDAGNPFFTDVAQGIEHAAEGADLSLFLCNSEGRAARERPRPGPPGPPRPGARGAAAVPAHPHPPLGPGQSRPRRPRGARHAARHRRPDP